MSCAARRTRNPAASGLIARYEVVVSVTDGSTDGTAEWHCARRQPVFPMLRLIEQDLGGAAAGAIFAGCGLTSPLGDVDRSSIDSDLVGRAGFVLPPMPQGPGAPLAPGGNKTVLSPTGGDQHQ